MTFDSSTLKVDERDRGMPDAVSRPYWDGLRNGELKLQRCIECGKPQFYPRALCMHCAGDVEWFTASGRGTVYSFSIVRFGFVEPFKSLAPYVLAIVELDEGPRMLTNIAGSPPEQVTIGAKARIEPVIVDDDSVIPFWILEDQHES